MTISVLSATISAGTSLSNAVQITSGPNPGSVVVPVRLIVPDQWDYSGGISFQSSPDGVTFRDLFAEHGELLMPIAAGVSIVLSRARYGLTNTYLKIRSGPRILPVNQTVDRVFQIVTETAPG